MRRVARLAAALALGAAAAAFASGAEAPKDRVLIAPPWKPKPPFRGAPGVKEAKAEAAKSDRMLFLNMITDHCPPCDRMHATTFKDPNFLEWIRKNATPVEINATQAPKASRELKITSYPTIVLFGKDGVELDRMMGYLTTKELLAALDDAVAGRTSLMRAREAVAKAKGDELVEARWKLARALAGFGHDAEAYRELAWLFDEGMKPYSSWRGVRVSFLLAEWSSVGERHEPAKKGLADRRAARAERLNAGKGTRDDASELASIDMMTGRMPDTLALYDSWPKGDPRRKVLGPSVEGRLFSMKRYEEAIEAAGIDDHAAEFTKRWNEPGMSPGDTKRFREYVLDEAGMWARGLAAAKLDARAKALLETVLKADPSPAAREKLKKFLTEVGRADLLPPAE